MLTRERRPMSAALLLSGCRRPCRACGTPSSAGRPSSDPSTPTRPQAAPRGAMARCAVALRSLADMLESASAASSVSPAVMARRRTIQPEARQVLLGSPHGEVRSIAD